MRFTCIPTKHERSLPIATPTAGQLRWQARNGAEAVVAEAAQVEAVAGAEAAKPNHPQLRLRS